MREVLKELKALLIKGCVQHSNVLHTRARTPPGPGLPAGVPGVTGCPRREPRAESRAGQGAVRGAERCAPLRGAPSEYKDASAARARLGDREKTYQPTRREKKKKLNIWTGI